VGIVFFRTGALRWSVIACNRRLLTAGRQ
jgi:hypothetical protein